ncbi:MAG TPA: hypothetical protein VFL81_03105 [Candidatus Saccharimonadales bacterium]|nr:hypothetical protein [Candidatus Saccharimonadales bacterium]
MELSEKELIDELIRFIGPRLTAFTAHSTSRAEFVLRAWSDGSAALHPAKLERLKLALELLNDVAEAHGEDQARAWFIGANCGGELVSPTDAIHYGDFDGAKLSAKRFINEEWS